MRSANYARAVLRGMAGVVSAAAMLLTGVVAANTASAAEESASTGASWSANKEFTDGLAAYRNYIQGNKAHYQQIWPDWNGSESLHDLGTKSISNGYEGTYSADGGLVDGSLNIQSYETTLQPGQRGELTIYTAGYGSGEPYVIAAHGDSTDAGAPEDYVRASFIGGVKNDNAQYLTGQSKGYSDFASFMTSSVPSGDMNYDPTAAVKGDCFAGAVWYVGSRSAATRAGAAGVGAVCGGDYVGEPDQMRSWFSFENTGSTPSHVVFSVMSTLADHKIAYKSYVFSDVSSSTAHSADIEWLKQAGITTGYDDGTFKPTANVNRQDMAAFLRRLAKSNNVSDATTWKPSAEDWSKFKDVNQSSPHAEDVLWLAHAGITTGYGDGTFQGGATVQRQDMAAFLRRLAKLAGKDGQVTGSKQFTDVNEKTPHAEDVAWLGASKISQGYPDGSFGVGQGVQRADMAAFLHRLDGILA